MLRCGPASIQGDLLRHGRFARLAAGALLSAGAIAPAIIEAAPYTPLGLPQPALTTDATPTSSAADPALEALERKKLQVEIQQLQLANERTSSWFQYLSDLAPLIGFAGVAATLAVTWRKNRQDELAQRRAEQVDAREALEARFTEQFSFAATNLAAAEPKLQVAGAAALTRLRNQGGEVFQRTLVQFLSAHLRLESNATSHPMLVENLAQALRALSARRDVRDEFSLDGVDLRGIDLRAVNLEGIVATLNDASISDGRLRDSSLKSIIARHLFIRATDFSGANLGFARLDAMDAEDVNFGGARFASSSLRDSRLKSVSFRGAALQSAHFEGAVLSKVDFAHADIRDCYLVGTEMDRPTINSLLYARNREAAHLDPVL